MREDLRSGEGDEDRGRLQQGTINEALLASGAPTAAEVHLLSAPEARIRVFREVAAFLEKNITTAEAHLAKLFPEGAPDPVPVEAANIASATLAAIELKDSLLITAHKLEKALNRPRILRPERSIKIAR